jgi:imidazolonepropionase-like amidohydrolase
VSISAGESFPETAHAAQFLTAPGGYPSRQAWAPAGSIREVETTTDAAAAVDEQLAAGASVIKVTLNTEAGPVLGSDVLAAIVAHAHDRDTPVVAHAQGVGQAVRAFVAGVDALAHTPFSERLVDGLVDAMAGRMTWISTLDIHGWGEENDDFARASDNLRRFHAHGGRVLYGTDLGNGPLPVGLNRREIEALLRAGLSPADVLGALTSALPRAGGNGLRADADTGRGRVTVVPGERPADPAGFADWLCGARAVSRSELKEYA